MTVAGQARFKVPVIVAAVLCSVGIIAVFAPLAIAQYRRISKR